MNEGRYTKAFAVDSVVLCTHCGCLVGDIELHDRVNGLDLIDAGNMAMTEQVRRIGEPLDPPEPTA